MSEARNTFSINIELTDKRCPVGEDYAERMKNEGKIPVLSCEGGCIRGEIARLAANMVAKEKPYARCCHAETFTVPDSAMFKWVQGAPKVVMIDGCFLKCHGRILKNLVDEKKIIHFDALSHYKKYTDLFDTESVPEEERKAVARDVADWVLKNLADKVAA